MHAFNIGSIAVHNIEEWQGPFATPDELFAGFDRERFNTFIDELPTGTYLRDEDAIYAFLQTWILVLDGQVLLYDTGAGNHKDRPGIPVFGNLDTPFLSRLAEAGFSPSDIDIVINSHLHIDHVGWNTQLTAGRWEPTFPNARYLFSAIDRDYWDPAGTGPRPTDVGRDVNSGVFEDSVQPLLDCGRAELVGDGFQVAPGVSLHMFPGHTPGHMVLSVVDGDDAGLFVGDILHHPAQIYAPEWNSVYCEDPDAARQSRLRVLEQAASTGARVVPAHFGGCHYAWVERSEDGFRPRYSDV
jgi:glyoxylase-like metal-dependent hydrolase (beta-lactamase superfamily II)